jgi:photosystem II stability/assembly factor-like uncharacterized protein
VSPTRLFGAPANPVVPGSSAFSARVCRLFGPAHRSFVIGLTAALITIGPIGAKAAGVQDYAPIAPKALASTMIDIERAGQRLVAVGERGHVLYSDDRGENWQQGKMPFRRMLTGVHFTDSRHGWAVGHQSMIFYSSDGGVTWVQQVNGFEFQQQFNEENLVRTREAYEALAAALEANPDPERELELEDALFAFEDAEFALEEPPVPTNFHDVWFVDRNTGWAVGAFGRLAETRDGGRTWTDRSHRVHTPDGLHLNAITGSASGEVFIAGEGGAMFRSLDAGATWEQMDVGYYGTFFGVLHDAKNSVLRVFGLGSALYQSRDQGVTWEPMESPVAATFAGGTVAGAGDTLLVGPGGMVFVIDGITEHIQTHPQPGRRNYSSALVLGENELVLVGQGGPQRVSLDQARAAGKDKEPTVAQ